MASDESQEHKKRSLKRHRRTVNFATLTNSELEPKFQKYKGRVVLRCGIVKDDSGSYAAFTKPGPSASQMTAAKVNGVKVRPHTADAVSACTQVVVQHQKNQWFFLNEICTDIQLPYYWGETSFEKCSTGHGWKKSTELRVLILCVVRKVYFSRYTWMTLHSLERSKTLILCGRNGWNTLIWENRILFLIMCTWDALNANVNLTKVGFDEKHRAHTTHCLTAFATYAQTIQLANIIFDQLGNPHTLLFLILVHGSGW